jgi:hypothetical protein
MRVARGTTEAEGARRFPLGARVAGDAPTVCSVQIFGKRVQAAAFANVFRVVVQVKKEHGCNRFFAAAPTVNHVLIANK